MSMPPAPLEPEEVKQRCLAPSADKRWTCSILRGHSGEHMAYGGHHLKDEYFRDQWPNPDARPEEIEQTLASIRDAMTRRTRNT